MFNFHIPREVLELLLFHFPATEFNVYIVGGYIRDAIFLNKKSYDLDFSIEPKDYMLNNDSFYVKKLLFKSPFWSNRVQIKNYTVHLTFFRKELLDYNSFSTKYLLSKNIYDDIYRRDITANTIYYDIYKKNIIDIFNIIKNLKLEVISTNSLFIDPSRIIRMLKYSQNLKIDLDINNKSLLQRSLFFFNTTSLYFNYPSFIFNKEKIKSEIYLNRKNKISLDQNFRA